MSTVAFPFMKLPLELQGMLWRFTWTDRVVIIQVGKLENPIQTWLKDETPETRFRAEAEQIEFQDAFHPNVKGFKKDIIHTPAQLPSTLFVNRESRHETLRALQASVPTARLREPHLLPPGDGYPVPRAAQPKQLPGLCRLG